MPSDVVCCGAGLASCFVGWECIKPLFMRGVTKVIVKVAPKYLGGAELELDKLNVSLSSKVRVDLKGLKVHNLKDKEFATPLLLSSERIVVEVHAKRAIESACKSRGKSIEVEVDMVHVNGLNLTVEKHLVSQSNVQEFLTTLKKKKEQQKEADSLEESTVQSLMRTAEKSKDLAISAVHGLTNGKKGKTKEKKIKLDVRMIDLHDVGVDMTSSWQIEQGLKPLHVKLPKLAVDMTPKDGSAGETDAASVINRMFSSVFQDILVEVANSGVAGAQDFASGVSHGLASSLEGAGGYFGLSWLCSFFYSAPKTKTTMRFKPGRLGLQITRSTGVINSIHEGTQASGTGIAVGWQIEALGGEPYTEETLDRLIAGREPFNVTFLRD